MSALNRAAEPKGFADAHGSAFHYLNAGDPIQDGDEFRMHRDRDDWEPSQRVGCKVHWAQGGRYRRLEPNDATNPANPLGEKRLYEH